MVQSDAGEGGAGRRSTGGAAFCGVSERYWLGDGALTVLILPTGGFVIAWRSDGCSAREKDASLIV
jgi:hypothetical protein